MKTFLAITLLLSASRLFSSDFSAFVGSWRVSESATIALWRSEAKTDAEKEHVEKLVQFKTQMKTQLKMPFHSDVEITSKAIVGMTGPVMPRYDLISAEKKESTVRARVLLHEDKNDPGDAYESAIGISSIEQKKLRFDTEVGMAISYVFEKK